MKVPSAKLNTGFRIPKVGLGLWKNVFPLSFHKTVEAALDAGYRHFDTAQIYGNEAMLGKALAKSGIDREDLFLTTKIWNRNQDPSRLEASLDRSLRRLKTAYVDLLLLHFPVTATRQAAWPIMEEIYKTGRAKAIGVSNYTIRHLEELLATCSVVPAVNQVEIHVFLQQPELREYCDRQGILVQAYSPLAHGRGLDNEILTRLAAKHGKTVAQVMIRWCLEQGLVPLPKSSHPDRILGNLGVFDFKLDKDDLAAIATLERGLRTCWDPTEVA